MTQNWISILKINWIFSKIYLLIYIYIYIYIYVGGVGEGGTRTQMVNKIHMVVASGNIGKLSSEGMHLIHTWTAQP